MICIQITPEEEKQWYDHCKLSLDVAHSPPFYLAQCKAYIRSYEMKHSDELPSFIDNVHGDDDE